MKLIFSVGGACLIAGHAAQGGETERPRADQTRRGGGREDHGGDPASPGEAGPKEGHRRLAGQSR